MPKRIKIYIILMPLLFVWGKVMAQDSFTGYYEPYIALDYEVTESYSHKFTLGNRSYWYDENFKAKIKQFDFAHFSSLKLTEKHILGLGVQYRFEENFEPGQENELRFTEEYTYLTKPKITELEHRFRAEQRIKPSLTSHRFRYSFGISRPFIGSTIAIGNAYLKANLETLLTVARTIKPEYEQRIGAGIGWLLADYVELELASEYRLSDFTQRLSHELFFITGLSVKL